MAQKNELDIFISRDGKVVIDVDGVRGPSCLEITKTLEESLGQVTEREKKAAFHAVQTEEFVSVSGGGGP